MGVRLVLLRHGQTAWNAEGRLQGQEDVPLNEKGLLQAASAATPVAVYQPVRIIASDLQRAAMTAQALGEVTGLEITYDSRLREIGYGQWEGRTRDEIGADVLAEVYESAENPRGVDGESLTDAAARTAEALAEIAASGKDGETIVVVTHGTVARAGVQHLLGVPHELWEGFRTMGNCHWLILEREPHRWQLVSYNLHA
ncbi:histidine phosphatase family protein [Propioniferax innocua]|uniref:Putative phosphoglycerate mutase n=1 Tax=Propioniferax innocua TaxID=1753 RepID=A0A542ZBT5_9ACTN|nr:histidine phosphatase family protein [Propioniferax innocua]TQL57739.1 putative phosphoglycerate mutase [Propioniferax innocua]